MAPSIGLNLRVTGYKHQGGRKYMEDEIGVAYQQTTDEQDLEYAFFGIFDGHGGREAALFAKENLMNNIVKLDSFWDESDESVLKAISDGFNTTHLAMWKELPNWPKTPSGLPSTAGTTASIAFIRRGKIFIGHVGDSAIVLGTQDPNNPDIWRSEPLTRDHKPESIEESKRIMECGGKVISKSGVPRVVWNRPKMGHKGPVRRSTHIDEIPFLAVARSLGDLWSWNSKEDKFVVSPEPDTHVYPLDINRHRCLVLGTDGAWNMLTPQNCVSTVCQAEKTNEAHILAWRGVEGRPTWINPSKQLVDCAIERWNMSKLRADNTSVITVMLDPPGPPRAKVLQRRKMEMAELNNLDRNVHSPTKTPERGSMAMVTNSSKGHSTDAVRNRVEEDDPRPSISVISRFPNSHVPAEVAGRNIYNSPALETNPLRTLHDFQRSNSLGSGRLFASTVATTTARSPSPQPSTSKASPSRAFLPPPLSSPPPDPPQDKVQCNEISSSDEHSPSTEFQGDSPFTEMPAPSPDPTLKSKLSNELRALNLTPLLRCTRSLDSPRTSKRRSKTPLDSPVALQKTKRSVASISVSKSSAKRKLSESPRRAVILETPLSKRARMRSESASHPESDQPSISGKSAKKLNKPVDKLHQVKAKLKKMERNIAKHSAEVRDLTSTSTDTSPRTMRSKGTISRTPKTPCKLVCCKTSSKNVKTSSVSSPTNTATSRTSRLSSKTSRLSSKTPKVTSKTPKVTLKASSVTSKTPRVNSKSPKVTPKTPKVNSKSSCVSLKTPKLASKKSSVTSKSPKVTSKTPRVTSKTSSVNSKTPKDSSKTSSVVSRNSKSSSKTSSLALKSPKGSIKSPIVAPKTPRVTSKTSSAVKRKRTGVDEESPAQKRPRTLIQSQSPKIVRGRQAKILNLKRKK